MQLGDEVIAPLSSYDLIDFQRESTKYPLSPKKSFQDKQGSLIHDTHCIRIDDILD